MKNQQGAGLLEVMIAVLILSISLLTIASLQSKSLQYNQSAYWRSQANVLAYDLLDRVRSLNGNEKTAAATGAHEQITQWEAVLARVLPSGAGALECEAVAAPAIQVCTVTVTWDESSLAGGEDTMSFSYSTSI